MDNEIIQLHLAAAKKAGQEKSCGKKQNHVTYENAYKASLSLNGSGKARHQVEPYPCPFCSGWHIGRVMTKQELITYINWQPDDHICPACMKLMQNTAPDFWKCPDCNITLEWHET